MRQAQRQVEPRSAGHAIGRAGERAAGHRRDGDEVGTEALDLVAGDKDVAACGRAAHRVLVDASQRRYLGLVMQTHHGQQAQRHAALSRDRERGGVARRDALAAAVEQRTELRAVVADHGRHAVAGGHGGNNVGPCRSSARREAALPLGMPGAPELQVAATLKAA